MKETRLSKYETRKEKCGYELCGYATIVDWMQLITMKIKGVWVQNGQERAGILSRVQMSCHQPEGAAKANIFGFSGCATGAPSVRPKFGEVSTPRILGFVSCPPTGVAGEPEEVGDAECE